MRCADAHPFLTNFRNSWASQENKQNLQLLVRDVAFNRVHGNVTIIASSLVSDDEALSATVTGGE